MLPPELRSADNRSPIRNSYPSGRVRIRPIGRRVGHCHSTCSSSRQLPILRNSACRRFGRRSCPSQRRPQGMPMVLRTVRSRSAECLTLNRIRLSSRSAVITPNAPGSPVPIVTSYGGPHHRDCSCGVRAELPISARITDPDPSRQQKVLERGDGRTRYADRQRQRCPKCRTGIDGSTRCDDLPGINDYPLPSYVRAWAAPRSSRCRPRGRVRSSLLFDL